MLKIGFVDHHLNNYHANKFLELLHGPLTGEEARVTLAWESHPTGEDWCSRHGIPRASSALAVAEHVDAVLVLAPDNIDAHLALCREVLPAGRPTFVDKFLAPDLNSAREIVSLARRHDAPLFSASSLRFAGELEAALAGASGTPTEGFARGMGDWNGYGVHTLSLAIGALGADVRRVLNSGGSSGTVATLDYGDGRRALVEVRQAANQGEVFPWAFGFRVGDRYVAGTVRDYDGFYANLMRRAVAFFKSGESPLAVGEMLRVVEILELANRSRDADAAWLRTRDD